MTTRLVHRCGSRVSPRRMPSASLSGVAGGGGSGGGGDGVGGGGGGGGSPRKVKTPEQIARAKRYRAKKAARRAGSEHAGIYPGYIEDPYLEPPSADTFPPWEPR